MKQRAFPLLLILLLASQLKATTWDEPWQEDVLRESEAFVWGEVKKCDEEKGFKFLVKKVLAGECKVETIEVEDFFLLDLCSVSGGHGPEFHLAEDMQCYLFLRKVKGNWCIPTPTTGVAPCHGDSVAATYRHSYHQALVPADVYESSMTALWLHAHGKEYDKQWVDSFLARHLAAPMVEEINEENMNTFFLQHVALEMIYHLELKGYSAQVAPFLGSGNHHNRLSAVRALSSEPSVEVYELIADNFKKEDRSPLEQSLSVMAITRKGDASALPALKKMKPKASEEGGSFGGNIMDPRVCTHLAPAKALVEQAMDKWK